MVMVMVRAGMEDQAMVARRSGNSFTIKRRGGVACIGTELSAWELSCGMLALVDHL